MTVPSVFTASLSPAERAAHGRDARRRAPRSSHGWYEAAPRRLDPVEVVERQSAERVPELVPIRYGRMLESPFRFYRGAAAIMAADLAPLPDTGLQVQLCGDAHPLNFRLLASPERRLVFDINDFDETLPGPFEWDVKRLAAGFVTAARANGFSRKEQNSTVRTCVRAYRERMREFAGMRTLDVWYAQDSADRLRELMASAMDEEEARRTARATERARTRTHLRAYAKLTEMTAQGRRITPDPPLITPLDQLLDDPSEEGREKELRGLVDQYARTLPSERRHLLRHYRLVDMARKVVGVGSVGTRCWILLLLGRDDDDPLVLQAKEAGASVLSAHTGGDRYDNQGRRVVTGQRLIQTTSDIFLGWTSVVGLDGQDRDFYVRQLWDWKGIAQTETMGPDLLDLFGRLCGASLARAHARSGDPIALAAYLGAGDRFDRALTEFAQSYADQNERDFAALEAARRSGRIRAERL
ncbi:DUF2252 domain-containing protein [Streptomyces justiciae]|uniref:DUF2252 domain-containing protein n=1 Tax=Streptomyces justiciae TaxID=2780140 RepID=UPI00187F887C|nr:DUF2252 domain-containing protein [Streptomyces justiciae]MBE8472306.1 DUF2252 domain-containing protein [Streptomyces justiciae]MCW8375815.1 DUF2252 domain-containing protein [Streptomyces justiciae]